jgi:hypothetical protein
MKKPKPRCAFKTDAEETKFRETHDSADYIDWSKAERALSKPEALDHSNLNASAAPLAGADQDRRQQARRAVSVPGQDVAGGKGWSSRVRATSPRRLLVLHGMRDSGNPALSLHLVLFEFWKLPSNNSTCRTFDARC